MIRTTILATPTEKPGRTTVTTTAPNTPMIIPTDKNEWQKTQQHQFQDHPEYVQDNKTNIKNNNNKGKTTQTTSTTTSTS